VLAVGPSGGRVAESDLDYDQLHRLDERESATRGLYDSLLRQAQIVEVQNPRYLDAMREFLEDHLGPVAKLARGDLAGSETAIEWHWQQSRERLRGEYSEFVGRSEQPTRPDALPAGDSIASAPPPGPRAS
jgi:hypothetical protein